MGTYAGPFPEEQYVLPGAVRISPAALQVARHFDEAIRSAGRDTVVVFDWAVSIAVRRSPTEPLEDVGPCLMLAAAERSDIPPGYIQFVDGVEVAVQIPGDVLESSPNRMIEVDSSRLFKLVLR